MNQVLKDCKTVWKNCLDVIRSGISEQSFSTWFEPIRPVKLVDNILTLEVPSPFFYEWLEEYYVHLLKKAIDKELGPNGKLEYLIVVDKGGKTHEPFRLKVRNDGPSKSVQAKTFQPPKKNGQPENGHYTSPFFVTEVHPDHAQSHLSQKYVFDTLIEGDCNRMARSAGLAIAKKPGVTAFNPFVVYGGVGLGKTHLAQAIGNEIKRYHPDKFVLYVTTEEFTAQFIEALKNNQIQDFTNYYLQVDALIIDDIQFFARKEKTQENFFQVFNRLHQSGKQIIMTSDCPPRDLQGLQERLLSRFKWGLTADVQPPDFETRIAILQTKLQAEGADIPEDVVEYLARNIVSNIREMEGVLVSIMANASFMRQEIDLELAKRTLINIVRSTEKEITIELIQKIVSDYFKIPVEDLKSKTRKKDIAMARHIAMYFSQHYTKLPLKSIGDSFGGRDHSTVVHATKTVSKKLDSDTIFSKIMDDLLDIMGIKK